MLTGTVLTAGNRVEAALDGDGTFPRLWEDLRSARDAITVQMYYGIGGQVADTLRDILVERARAGVRVFVLYDAFGNQGIPASDLAALRKARARVVAFRPLSFANLYVLQNRSTSVASWSTAAWVGRAGSASTTSGSATGTPGAGGATRTCASKGRRCSACRRRLPRHGRRRRGRSSPDGRR
jgi:hypothetical protein